MRTACVIVANLFAVREFLKKGADFCSMCGPHFCSMKITDDVRRCAKEKAIDESSAIEHGLRRKAEEFQHSGAEIYSKP